MSRWGGRSVMVLRRQWQARIDAGDVDCARCGYPLVQGQVWDIGHTVDRALGGTAADGLAPEHARCNRAAGGRLAARLGVGAHARRTPGARRAPVPVVERRKW
jgi:hypothetical protein